MIDACLVKNLVFSGGGVRGYSYAGVLTELVAAGVRLDQLEGVGGTSMGAMFALAVACGWTPAELVAEVMQQNVKQWLSLDLHALWTKYGIIEGDAVRAYFDTVLLGRLGRGRGLTLKELHAITGKRLVMIACDLAHNTELVMSHEMTPELKAADACFMSMAIPGLFAPLEYNGALCCDGGIKNNFPLNHFPAHSTIGVRVSWGHALSMTSVDQVLGRVVYCILSESENFHWSRLHATSRANTVEVHVGDLSTIELQLTRAHKHMLINCGRLAVRHALVKAPRTRTWLLLMAMVSLTLIGLSFHGPDAKVQVTGLHIQPLIFDHHGVESAGHAAHAARSGGCGAHQVECV
jgi:predicted acylesterase/phospholipase RssA